MRHVTRKVCPWRALPHLAMIALCLAAPTVTAQDSPATDSQGQMALEEVIVTARKREESLQATPVAISAFSAEALEIAGIANTRDLQQSVPGLIFSEQGQ